MACGDSALLIEVENVAEVITVEKLLTQANIPGVAEIMPASKSVLVSLEPGEVLANTEDHIRAALSKWAKPHPTPDRNSFRIPVSYGSTDLHECAFLMDTTIEDIIGWHSELIWNVANVGAEPGVFYMTSENNPINFGRRAVHRRVPDGSILLADRSCIVVGQSIISDGYVIGQTEAVMWDPLRTPISLLRPGLAVSFQEAKEPATSRRREPSHAAHS